MAAVLGCPAGAQSVLGQSAQTPEEACAKLLSCSILAEERFTAVKDKDGKVTGYTTLTPAHLDYEWCVSRLRRPPAMPCVSDAVFGPEHVAAAIRCIMATTCPGLGLQIHRKVAPPEQREGLDLYLCPDNAKVWTATTCDYGILRYQ